MKNKKYGIKKRRTNIMPEHLRRQEFVIKELANSLGRYIIDIMQSNLDKHEWRVQYTDGNNIVSTAINSKNAHKLCELGYPCFAYIGNGFVQVNEEYFTG